MALGEILMEDVRIVFRNFAGKEGQYNREGDRNFSVVLDEKTADELEEDGWNVKRKPPKEEGDDSFNHLSVSVSFKGRPPRVSIVTSKNRTVLEEQDVEMLDWIDIEHVDVIIRPYEWRVNGKTGVKAYLKTIYVKIVEDELDLKYEHLPQVGGHQRPELTAGASVQMPALPPGEQDIIDIEAEWDDVMEEEKKAPPRGRGKS